MAQRPGDPERTACPECADQEQYPGLSVLAILALMSEFVDEGNPTIAELRLWAASALLQPMQDWDLIVSLHEPSDELLDLVEGSESGADFFLSCLYIKAGDAVRAGHPERLERVLDSAKNREHRWLQTWVRRTQALVSSPDSFDYGAWCDGGLAADPEG